MVGTGVEKNLELAALWFQKALEQGNLSAQNNLGWMYFSRQGSGAADVQRAKLLFQEAAEKGNSYSQSNLAYAFFLHGIGDTQRDLAKVEELICRSASSAWALGIAHEHGWGGRAKDDVKAEECYRSDLRCMSKTLLGRMYEDGRGGLDRNLNEAARLYMEAIEEGDVVARGPLGRLYEFGLGGLPKDLAKAKELYESARTWEAREALARMKERCVDASFAMGVSLP